MYGTDVSGILAVLPPKDSDIEDDFDGSLYKGTAYPKATLGSAIWGLEGENYA